jgi:hypothetical protein
MENLVNKKVVVVDGSLAAELKKFNFDFEVKQFKTENEKKTENIFH